MSNWGKGLLVVLTIGLLKTPSNKASFVSLY
uniref:Uncharacterized protein n=1 Tax=Arundo donax TaxID=35708 RepID=A0A0A8ZU14_ARUDO